MSRIGDRFSELRSRAAAGFIPYLTFGDPEADWTVPLLEALDRAGADLIELLAPTSSLVRMRKVLSRARGFVYFVSVAGVTGARATLPENLETLVRSVKRLTSMPIGVGFGISTPEQAARVATFADAVIV